MAVPTMTVDYAVARLSHIVTGSSTVDTNHDAEFRFAIDWAVNKFVSDGGPQSFNQSATVTLAAGTTDYDLADDFHQIIHPGVVSVVSSSDFRTLNVLTLEDFEALGLRNNTSQSEPTHYTLLWRATDDSSWQIRFYPTPPNIHAVRYSYRASPTVIRASSSGDGTLIDRRFPPLFFDDIIYAAASTLTNYLAQDTRAYYTGLMADAIRRMRGSSVPVVGNVAQQRRPYGSQMIRGYSGYMPQTPFT